ncbi:MAG: phospholipid carrier-dependent glycosyltransferase, partial [Chloroflexia bacterium]|nr:phospholipid carrier-dependent glycosyltransferase [Chloroflexia bacterium]
LTLIAALALLALAVGLLNTQVSVAGGLLLALVALLIMTGGSNGLGKDLWLQDSPDLPRRPAILVLGLIFLLALGLRFYRLDDLPFGLWRDEARHGMFAQLIRDYADYRPIYIASNRVNMPALGLYPFALALHFWGENLWSMRVVSGLAGALTVVPLYGFASWLSGRRSIGLLAALFLAVSSWHITVSRLAFPTVFDPLLTLSGLWLLGWGLCPQNPVAVAQGQPTLLGRQRIVALLACLLGGVCLGLAVQTYHTGRMAPIIAAWLALLLLLRAPQAWRGWLVGSLVAGVGLVLTVTPLLLYAFNQPEAFNDRVNQVFLLSEEARRGEPPLRMLDTTLRQHLLMFHGEGDLNGRHHAPGRPMLDYVTGIGMLLGVAVLLRYPLDWRSLMLAGALAIGLVPSALAVNGPHGLRGFSAAAFAFIIAAVGWVALWQSLNQHWPAASRPRWLPQGVGATLITLVLALNAAVYFVLMPPQREVFLVFYPVQSQMGAYVRELADANGGTLATQVYVPEVVRSDPVFAFLTTGLAVQSFAGAELSEPAEPDAIFLLSGYFAAEEAAALASILGGNAKPIAEGPAFPDGQGFTFYVYKIARTARIWSGVVRQHPPMSCAPSAYQVRAWAPKSTLEHSPDHDRDAISYCSPEFG